MNLNDSIYSILYSIFYILFIFSLRITVFGINAIILKLSVNNSTTGQNGGDTL